MRHDFAAPLADLLARMPRDGWFLHRRGHLRRTGPSWEECPMSSTRGYSTGAYRDAAAERGYPIAFRNAVIDASDSCNYSELRAILLAHLGLTEVSP